MSEPSIERRLVGGEWRTVEREEGDGGGLPDGGSTGEVLTKASGADQDVEWAPGGGSQPSVTVPISSAEILAFATTRKEIVAAPGSGKALMPRLYLIQYLPGDTAYTEPEGGNSNLTLGWGDAGSGNPVATAHVNGQQQMLYDTDPHIQCVGDALFDFDVNGPPLKTADPADIDDAPLTFGFNPGGPGGGGSATVTDGDGTLVVTVTYDVIDLA